VIFFVLSLPCMAQKSYDIEPRFERGYSRNPDWKRDFKEEQDRRTRTINRILDITVRENVRQNNTMLSDVYFTKYWCVGNYFFVYRLRDDYSRVDVLIRAIIESTDEVLSWYDLTTQFNFDIIIVTPYRTIVRSYFDLLYEYQTMSTSSYRKNHPRNEELKEWLVKTRHRRYERVTPKTFVSNHPYSTSIKLEQNELLELRGDITSREMNSREQREYLGLRNDDRQVSPQEYRGIGILPGEYNDNMSVESHQQQIIERQRELYQNQMSLRWSDYGVNNSCEEIELPNVTVTPRVTKSKLSKILNKLKW
jgi:hypothetical protein